MISKSMVRFCPFSRHQGDHTPKCLENKAQTTSKHLWYENALSVTRQTHTSKHLAWAKPSCNFLRFSCNVPLEECICLQESTACCRKRPILLQFASLLWGSRIMNGSLFLNELWPPFLTRLKKKAKAGKIHSNPIYTNPKESMPTN